MTQGKVKFSLHFSVSNWEFSCKICAGKSQCSPSVCYNQGNWNPWVVSGLLSINQFLSWYPVSISVTLNPFLLVLSLHPLVNSLSPKALLVSLNCLHSDPPSHPDHHSDFWVEKTLPFSTVTPRTPPHKTPLWKKKPTQVSLWQISPGKGWKELNPLFVITEVFPLCNPQWIQAAQIWYLQWDKTGQTWMGDFFCRLHTMWVAKM